MCESTTGTKRFVEVGFGRTASLPFDTALRAIERSLEKEGFGVLTRIDVSEIFRKKLGVERPPFVILGVCNPQLAHRALGLEPGMALLLPCNVTVREVVPGETRVESIDPVVMSDLFPESHLEGVALEARQGLTRVIETFGAPVPA